MNSLKLYDVSFTDKLKAVFPNTVYSSTDEAFEVASTEGKVKLPLISLYRLENPPLYEEMYNHAESFRGRMTSYSAKSSVSCMTLPVDLSYQIDIWAKSRDQLDTIFCELLFFMKRNPNITINVEGLGSQDFGTILTDSNTSDTDYSGFKDIGRLYRMSLTYEIPTAKLFYFKNHSYLTDITDTDGNLITGSSIKYDLINIIDK